MPAPAILYESLFSAARIKPAVLQNRFYKETGYDAELRAFFREHRIRYQSFWTLTANPDLPRLGRDFLKTPMSRPANQGNRPRPQ
jgi:hypothetical protein